MFPDNKKLGILLIVAVFLLSVTLSLLLHSYHLAVGGLLIIVVISALIPGWKSTFLSGLFSMVIMTALVIYFKDEQTDITQALFAQVYSLLLILFAVVLIFYLKRMQQTFAYEKTHMTSLFENATEGILLTDKNGRIVLVNPAAENLFGYTAGELTGQPIEQLIPTRYQHRHGGLRDSFYHHPSSRTMGVGRDLFAMKKDKSEFPVEVSLGHYQQRDETFVIAFVVDITKRKEAEQRVHRQTEELEKISQDIRKLNADLELKVEERTQILQEALIRLEQSQKELSELLDKEKHLNEIKSRFVSMASHEFRTPLSTILSSATLVSKYPAAEEFDKREKHIRRIRDSVNHMNELLEDFLSLGKLEEGKMTVNVSSFLIAEFAEDVTDEMRSHLKPGQELNMICGGSSSFSTDKRMLKNIVLNLLSNAIKFSPDNSPVDFSMKQEDNKLFITVSDRGLGIPEEDKPYLFSTFFRAKNVSNIQGTGLGLPIIKRYADLLHGTVNFTSEPGHTVFTVILPELPVTADK